MIPPISVPIYEPPTYVLSGLTFPQLPLNIQRYLLDTAKLVPPHARHLNSIEREHSIISHALLRSLEGNDNALVDMRHKTLTMACDLARGILPTSAQWHQTAQHRRINTVVKILLPARTRLFNAFMIKFDALVWLDQQGREHYTPEDWQRYRDALLKPMLDYINNQLVALDRVRNRPGTNGFNALAPPNPSYAPFGSYHGRARSWRFTPLGPDSGEDWPRGRRLRRHS